MNFYALPKFIPEEIVGAPIDFPWEGAQEHIGPVETLTPLMMHLGRGNGLAQVAMCAGILLWLTWRLKTLTDVEHNLELAEAAFAYTIDWRYVDINAGPKGKAPDQPPEVSAAKKVNSLVRRALNQDTYWNSFFTPVAETFHAANVVQHIVPTSQKGAFEHWLLAVSDRMHAHFPLPDLAEREFSTFESEQAYDAYVAPRRGVAIPPEILDTSVEYDPGKRDASLAKFLTGLDRGRNRFLRSPEEMLELGFEGRPYEL
jgi:hypothetical protein